MDDLAVGRLIMLARQRRNWRQVDLARAAGVSQQLVAVVEGGRLAQLSLRTLRRVAEPLEMRVLVNALWRGGEADRLRDRDHAMLVEHVIALLQARGWEVIVEYTFSHYGERGSIDLVAWHPSARALLVIEVKTRIYDVRALLSAMDRKARLAGKLLAAERGWAPRAVGRVLVVPALSANRALVVRHTGALHRDASRPRSGGPFVAPAARRRALRGLVPFIYPPGWWYSSGGGAPAGAGAWWSTDDDPRPTCHHPGW